MAREITTHQIRKLIAEAIGLHPISGQEMKEFFEGSEAMRDVEKRPQGQFAMIRSRDLSNNPVEHHKLGQGVGAMLFHTFGSDRSLSQEAKDVLYMKLPPRVVDSAIEEFSMLQRIVAKRVK